LRTNRAHLAGSYLVEKLTDEIESQAENYIQKIDAMGGALAAIERGYTQGEIQEAAYRYQRAVENNEHIVVGINAFEVEEQIDLEQIKVDPLLETAQQERLKTIRARRDDPRVSKLLTQLEITARNNDNLLPLLITCVESDITLGEITGVLRAVWGEYEAPSYI